MAGRTARRRVTRVTVDPGGVSERADLLAAEEPLGIRIGGQAVSLTMRTPGDDIDLAAGFLVSEGIVASAADIASITICDGQRCGHDHEDDDEVGNIADVTLRPGLTFERDLRRSFLTSSACGVCGKASIEDLHVPGRFDLFDDRVVVTADVLAGLPDALRRCAARLRADRRAARGRPVQRRRANCWWCARTWGGITPSTRWLAGHCKPACSR